MRFSISKSINLTLLITCFFCQTMYAQPLGSYDIYYVSVGNSNYLNPTKTETFCGLYDIKGAKISANFIAECLQKAGSKYGILLESSKDCFITKDDISKAINAVSNHMDFDSENERLFVFYYCGHGTGEAITGRHYIVPGNVVLDTTSFADKYIDFDKVENQLIYSVDLLESIRQYSDQQLVMLDCCYEEPTEKMVLDFFTSRLGTQLNEFISDLREIHQYRDPFNTVIYAGSPGVSVRPVSPPRFMKKRAYMNNIGRICRKFCIYANDVVKGNQMPDYHNFLTMMNDKTYDLPTQTIITYSGKTYYNKTFFQYDISENKIKYEERKGTGKTKVVLSATDTTFISPIYVLRAYSGLIEILSEEGDWIGGGNEYNFTPNNGEIMVMNQGNRLVIHFQEFQEYEYYSFEFLLPKKHVINHNYTRESNYYWLGHKETEISATGRGCSESIGKLKVNSLERDSNGLITKLNIDFSHRCKDSSAKLIGSINLLLHPVIE